MNIQEVLLQLDQFGVIETVDMCKEVIGRDYGHEYIERIEGDAGRIYEEACRVHEEGDYGLMAGGLLMMQASLYLFVSASELFDRQEFLSEVDQIERGTR